MRSLFLNFLFTSTLWASPLLGLSSALAQTSPHSSDSHCILNNPNAEEAVEVKPAQPEVEPITDKKGNVFFTLKNQSGPSELALAQHLKKVGAVMYDVHWCPHCYEQKELFGVEAQRLLTFIECDPAGVSAQPEFCQQRLKIALTQQGEGTGYPTWEINGKFYTGTQTLKALATHSGYEGPMNFQNSRPRDIDDTDEINLFKELFKPKAPPETVMKPFAEQHSSNTQ